MKKIIMSLLVFATSFAMAQEEAPVAEAKAAVEVAAPAAPVSVALTGDDAELSDAYQDAVLTVNDGKHTIVTEGSAKLNEDGKVEFVNDSRFWVSNLFLMMSAVLVFIMHLGFCTLEVGARSNSTWGPNYKSTAGTRDPLMLRQSQKRPPR